MHRSALLALEDGSYFEGNAFGYSSHEPIYTVGEVVFNTAMTGYQEILSDPSYAGQFISLTYPQIGNVGVNKADNEAAKIHAKGLIIRQLPRRVSNWRHEATLEAYLADNHIIGIADIDTRRLTRLLRDKGALKGCIYTSPTLSSEDLPRAIQLAQSFGGLKGLDLAKEVTTSQPYRWKEGGTWPEKTQVPAKWHVVAYDFGVKKTILRCLRDMGCDVTVVPATTPAEYVLDLSPDGIFLSNGPGDPEPCDYAIQAISHFLLKNVPIFGICLGHQLLALACGAKTVKMKCGHHGGNHPVQRVQDNKVLITSQNHGFAVEENGLPSHLEITHRSLFDNTIQGIRHRQLEAFGFQGHPEAGPGPNDARELFKEFVDAMQRYRTTQKTKATAVLETI